MKLNVILFSVLVFMIGCGDDDGPDPAELGAACEKDTQCEDGTCLTELPGNAFFPGIEFPEGMCTAECETPGEECLDGTGVCLIHTVSQLQYCFETCEKDMDCREGYFCLSFDPSTAACVPVE